MMHMFIAIIWMSLGCFVGVEGWSLDKSLLGTKTAYDWATDVSAASFVDDEDTYVDYEDRRCEAIHVNLLIKHGSRYPGMEFVDDIDGLAARIRGNKASAGALDFIDTWTSSLKRENEYMLSPLGKQEMLNLGTRVGKRYKQLLMDNSHRTEFISSTRDRAKDSGKHFSRGLSLYLHNKNETSTPSENNNLLRVFDNCEYFAKTVDDNEKLLEEMEKFQKASKFTTMKEDVAKRLRIVMGVNLSDDDVMSMWEMCVYELIAGRNHTWCLMLTDEDRRTASYASDLQNYYTKSYGNGISGQIHCVVVTKMLAMMDDAMVKHKDGLDNYTIGSFVFGHAATLIGTATAFNLFKDDTPLRSTSINTNRKFVSSRISPMAGNLGFALYECRNQDDTDTKYAVKMFHNERDREMNPFGKLMVWYDDFKQAFEGIAQCDIDALCKYPRGTSGAGRFETLGFVLLISLHSFLVSVF